MVKIGAIAFSATLLAATIAFAQTAPTRTGDTTKGKVLADGKGMTLYTFDKDDGGKSACNGPCATNWPPLMRVTLPAMGLTTSGTSPHLERKSMLPAARFGAAGFP
jgi:predicted lipoprotein with Yx(FWY)xxD motif